MARPRIYDDTHFAFTRRLNPNGSIYVIAYRNEWDLVKKRSRVKERHTVGVLNQATGRVRIGKTYLKNHPEMEGKVFYYENNQLIEASLEEEEKKEAVNDKSDTSHLDDIISWGATYACLQTFKELKIKESLVDAFGEKDAVRLMQLAVYQYLVGGASRNFQEWAPGVWMPGCGQLTSQRISEVLARVNQEKMTKYFKLRFDAANERIPAEDGFRFLALDSTAISTYSKTIENAAYGHAKQNPELKQVNYTLGVDYLSGDILYGYECEGSIGDKSIYPELLKDMRSHGFALEKTVLVTDRGYESIYNIQQLLNENANYICGVPLTEKSVKDKFLRYWESLHSCAFYDENLDVYARSDKEEWLVRQKITGGTVRSSYWIHYYRDPQRAELEQKALLETVGKVLKAKREGKEPESKDWKEARRFIQKDEKLGWVKNVRELDKALHLKGCFAIRTNCMENPFKALEIYRERNIVETNFRIFKVENDGCRVYSGHKTYLGKLFVYTLATSLRFYQLMTMCENAEKMGIKRTADSLETAMFILKRLKAVKSPRSGAWKTKPVSKKARDALALLNIEKLPEYLH